jgi:hypothetical protein
MSSESAVRLITGQRGDWHLAIRGTPGPPTRDPAAAHDAGRHRPAAPVPDALLRFDEDRPARVGCPPDVAADDGGVTVQAWVAP